MIKRQDILCLSSQDWNDLWTRKQRFMQRFARQGNRVLYIESQASLVSLGVYKDDWKRIFRWLRGPRKIEDNLYVVTLPLVIPFFQMSGTINEVNNWIILKLLRNWMRELKFRNPILWTYTPHSESLIGKLGERFSIYECVDDLSASKGLVRAGTVHELEKRLIEKVNLVIVTHENLLKSKKALGKEIHLIPNGAEVEHFKKASLPETTISSEMVKIPKPIIGFLGSIQYWIDLDLIRHIALSKSEWSIVLIGPIGRLTKIEKIKALPNVHLLGRKDYASIPSYIKAWDVCINPYVLDKTAENCSPLKLYEYLATGKPVVSVDMPEARKFNGLIEIGTTYQDFLEKIQQILNQFPEEFTKIKDRIKAVERHSWNHRFFELERILEPYLEKV